jgi:hypothetical protein
VRFPWSRPIPAPRAEPRLTLPSPAPKPLDGWCREAYLHGVVVSSLALAHGDDEAFKVNLRPVLLDHARQLVQALLQDETSALDAELRTLEYGATVVPFRRAKR